jgi:hypothetical protein
MATAELWKERKNGMMVLHEYVLLFAYGDTEENECGLASH